MFHTCELCSKQYIKEKTNSHIIPRMFFRDYKAKNGNKPFYSSINGRITQEDPKEFLLCDDCEQYFCKYESIFSQKIFEIIKKYPNRKYFYINDDIRFATLSILWRVLKSWVLPLNGNGELNSLDIEKLKAIEHKWLGILKNHNNKELKKVNMFLIPTSWIKDSDISDFKKYPGFVADCSYFDQQDNKGYFTFNILTPRLLIFSYSTDVFTFPKSCSLRHKMINNKNILLPISLKDRLIRYLKNFEV